MTGSREASAPRIALIIAALALLLAALSLGGGQRAFAHADYESSTPADGETVSESPERVEVVFGQEAARQGGLPTLIVVNQFGDLIADEAVLDDVDRTHMSVALPPALGSGRYTVIWHTVSDEDGEEAQGAFHFYVGAGPSATTQATAGPDATPQTAAPTVVNGGTGDGGGEGSDVPLWALIGGVVVSLMAGSGAGVALAARRPD